MTPSRLSDCSNRAIPPRAPDKCLSPPTGSAAGSRAERKCQREFPVGDGGGARPRRRRLSLSPDRLLRGCKHLAERVLGLGGRREHRHRRRAGLAELWKTVEGMSSRWCFTLDGATGSPWPVCSATGSTSVPHGQAGLQPARFRVGRIRQPRPVLPLVVLVGREPRRPASASAGQRPRELGSALVWLEHLLVELVAGFHAELAKRLA
jgi:hypothetical protein